MDTAELDGSETAELKTRSERPEGAQEGTLGVSHCPCLCGTPESVSLIICRCRHMALHRVRRQEQHRRENP